MENIEYIQSEQEEPWDLSTRSNVDWESVGSPAAKRMKMSDAEQENSSNNNESQSIVNSSPTDDEKDLQNKVELLNIFGLLLNCIPSLAADDKLKLENIKSIDISSLFNLDNNEKLETLSQLKAINQELKLKMIHLKLPMYIEENLEDLWKSCRTILSNILWNNRDTIEYLVIEPFALSELFKYPKKMEAVKKIRLYIPPDAWEVAPKDSAKVKFFGKGFDFAKSFPNLTEITLDGCCTMAQLLGFLPRDANTSSYFRTVTSLDLKLEKFTEKSVERAAKLFPNITRLFINGHVRWLFSHLAEIFRLWPKLTSLTLRIFMSCTMDQHKYFLDSICTGISAEKCTELRNYEEKMKIDLKNYRKNFAIPNMTDLKELTFIIGGSEREYKKTPKVIPLLSHVAAFYGFQCLPDLKVTVAIPLDCQGNKEIRDTLSSIEGYVMLIPNYYGDFADKQ